MISAEWRCPVGLNERITPLSLRVMRSQTRRAARAGRTGFRFDDGRHSRSTTPAWKSGYRPRIDVVAMQPALEIRSAVADLLAVQLGDAIDELAEQIRAVVLVVVPGRIAGGIVEPEVGAEIDDDRRHLPQRSLILPIATPCGSATKSTSHRFEVVELATNLRSVRLRRFGWTERTNLPAFRSEVTCFSFGARVTRAAAEPAHHRAYPEPPTIGDIESS